MYKCSCCGKDFQPTDRQVKNHTYGMKWGRKNVYCSQEGVRLVTKIPWSKEISAQFVERNINEPNLPNVPKRV